MKYIGLILILFIVKYSHSQINNEYKVNHNLNVHKKCLSNKYASYELLQLGELDYMQFELLASEVRKDSVHFEIALWACIWYYGSSDWWNRKPIPQSCIYQNNKFNLLVVEVQQQFFSEINKKSQRGLYKVKKKFKQLNKVNDTINITFKKENVYNFIFEFGDFKSRYIQLESK